MRAPGRSRGNRKNPALTGGSGDPRIRFTLPFCETITIRDNRASRPNGMAATGHDRRRPASRQEPSRLDSRGWQKQFWEIGKWQRRVRRLQNGCCCVLGTRASANTSGPDFMEGFGPDEIADQRSAPNEENQFLLPDRFSKERTPRKNDPAV